MTSFVISKKELLKRVFSEVLFIDSFACPANFDVKVTPLSLNFFFGGGEAKIFLKVHHVCWICYTVQTSCFISYLKHVLFAHTNVYFKHCC